MAIRLPLIDFNRCRSFRHEDWIAFDRFAPHLSLIIARSMVGKSGELPPPGPETPADDIVITCDLCNNAQWWIDNFGALADAAHWFYCGPLGLNCPAGGG